MGLLGTRALINNWLVHIGHGTFARMPRLAGKKKELANLGQRVLRACPHAVGPMRPQSQCVPSINRF